jgi:hypothetical protein
LKALKRGAAVAATVTLMGGAAMLAGTATAGAATTYSSTGDYQFASNTGGPGLTGSSDTYFRVGNDPFGYTQSSQALAADGVDLSVNPDNGYADSGVIVPLGTIANSGLLASDGSLNLPDLKGSSNLQVNIYFDTNGDGKYFSFNSDGVYEGSDGDTYAITSGKAVPAATVSADENTTEGTKTEIWAWVGIDSTTNGTPVTGYVSAVNGFALSFSSSSVGTITNSSSHKCLDVKNANYTDNAVLQQWACGADGGADQQFRVINTSDGNSYLQAVNAAGAVLNVTSLGPDKSDRQLVLETPGNGTGNQVMAKKGPFYTFPGDNLVMDDAGSSTANGAEIIGYPQNGGTNQQWSLP